MVDDVTVKSDLGNLLWEEEIFQYGGIRNYGSSTVCRAKHPLSKRVMTGYGNRDLPLYH